MNFSESLACYKELMSKAERYIWNNAEVGYKEYKTDAYMKKAFKDLGYEIKEAGDITGFSAEIDTGREGPTLALLAELDALYCSSHPETNKETGAVHACGHNIQCASLLGVAAVLREKNALDNLCGKIRLIVVPAEEGVEIAYRNQLIKDGKITFTSGKPEMIKRGFFDGVDIAFMVHIANLTAINGIYSVEKGYNGNIRKKTVIKGRASHAGCNPSGGINALNAASLAISATNYLRETFKEEDKVRFHSIITEGGSSVNVVPDEVVIESYVRASNVNALVNANERINRAITCACASIGAEVEITDMPGSYPLRNDEKFLKLTEEVFYELAGDRYLADDTWVGGCTDMGDVSTIVPVVHANVGGLVGLLHGKDYKIEDPMKTCFNSANLKLKIAEKLLENGAKRAKEIIENYKPEFKDVSEYVYNKEKLNKVLTPIKISENSLEIDI